MSVVAADWTLVYIQTCHYADLRLKEIATYYVKGRLSLITDVNVIARMHAYRNFNGSLQGAQLEG